MVSGSGHIRFKQVLVMVMVRVSLQEININISNVPKNDGNSTRPGSREMETRLLTTVNSKHRTSSLIHTSGLRQPQHTLTFTHTCTHMCTHKHTLYAIIYFCPLHAKIFLSWIAHNSNYYILFSLSCRLSNPSFVPLYSKFSTRTPFNSSPLFSKLFPLSTPPSRPAPLLHSPLHSILGVSGAVFILLTTAEDDDDGGDDEGEEERGVMRKTEEAGVFCFFFPGVNGTDGCRRMEEE